MDTSHTTSGRATAWRTKFGNSALETAVATGLLGSVLVLVMGFSQQPNDRASEVLMAGATEELLQDTLQRVRHELSGAVVTEMRMGRQGDTRFETRESYQSFESAGDVSAELGRTGGYLLKSDQGSTYVDYRAVRFESKGVSRLLWLEHMEFPDGRDNDGDGAIDESELRLGTLDASGQVAGETLLIDEVVEFGFYREAKNPQVSPPRVHPENRMVIELGVHCPQSGDSRPEPMRRRVVLLARAAQ